MRWVFIIVMSIFLSGCATLNPYNNPYYSQYQELDYMYQTGQLTPEQYIQAKQNLMQLELQWRNQLSSALGQSLQNLAEQERLQQQWEDYIMMRQVEQWNQPPPPIWTAPYQPYQFYQPPPIQTPKFQSPKIFPEKKGEYRLNPMTGRLEYYEY